jgi:hypothetical protein
MPRIPKAARASTLLNDLLRDLLTLLRQSQPDGARVNAIKAQLLQSPGLADADKRAILDACTCVLESGTSRTLTLALARSLRVPFGDPCHEHLAKVELIAARTTRPANPHRAAKRTKAERAMNDLCEQFPDASKAELHEKAGEQLGVEGRTIRNWLNY